MKRWIIIILCSIGGFTVTAQQLQITEDPFAYSFYHPSPGFHNNFSANSHVSYSLYNSKDYTENNVQSLKVYDQKKNLVFTAEFDREGSILRQGQKGMRYFIGYKTIKVDSSNYIQIQSYSKENIIHRVDSTFIQKHSYMSGDTILSYATMRMKKYYLGKLINEQNEYYNTHYQDMPIREDDWANQLVYVPSNKKDKRKKVYLDFKYPVNFVEDSLYFFSDWKMDTEKYGQLGRYEIEREKLESHPFFKSFGQNDFNLYPVEGAEFEEPRWMQESMWCGNSMYSQQHYYDGRNSGTKSFNNGLISEIWEDYYPEDPNPKPRPERQTNSTDSIEVIEIIDIPDYIEEYVPRLATPVRTIKYTFSYEYFE